MCPRVLLLAGSGAQWVWVGDELAAWSALRDTLVRRVHPTACHRLAVRQLREELSLLHEPGSYVGEVVKAMDKKKVLVKVSVWWWS